MIGPNCHGCPDPTSTCLPEKFKAMNATERAAFIEKLKERRRQRESGGGGE